MSPPSAPVGTSIHPQYLLTAAPGHVHYATATTSALFTQVGALTQEALDTAFFVATVSAAAPEIRLKRAGLHRYADQAGEPAAASKWS